MEENIPKQAAEPMPAPEKTKKKSPVLTIILILVALAGIGFGVYGMCFNKPTEKECIESEVAEKGETEEKVEDEDYTVYYSLIDEYVNHSTNDNTGKFRNDGFEDIDYMASVATKSLRINSLVHEDGSINKDILVEKVKELFNYDFGNVKNFDLGCRPYSLDTNTYLLGAHGCGGAGGYDSVTTIININHAADELEITFTQADVGWSASEGVSLKNKSGEKVFEQTIEESSDGSVWDEAKESAKKYFEEHLNEFNSYKLIFKKADKHYYLESGEKIN